MPKRVAIGKINLGGGMIVKPGETFDFSPQQIKELEAMSPPVIRMPAEEKAARVAANRQQPDDDAEREVGEREPEPEETGNGKGRGRGKGRASEL